MLERIAEWLGVEFKEVGGNNFYKRAAVAYKGCIRVAWDNVNASRSVMVEFTGEAMRYIESRPDFGEIGGWRNLMQSWSLQGWKCRRLDVAIDDRGYNVPWDVPFQHIQSRAVACRSMRGDVDGWEVRQRARKGHLERTLYVGSRQGENFLRIYEKGRQLGESVPWLRFELEIKKDRAELAMQTYIAKGEDALYGMMRAFIEFKDRAHEVANVTQRRVAAWWAELVSTSKYVVNLPARAKATLMKLVGHIRHQWGPNMLAITKAAGGSVDWLYEILQDSELRQKAHHREIATADVGNFAGFAAGFA